MKRALPCLVGVALLVGSGVSAQEAIPTAANAPGGGAPPVQATAGGPITIQDKRSERDDRGPVPIGPCGVPYKMSNDGPPRQDKTPHGEAWAGVGTHGYRDVGGAVCIPVGKAAEVIIAVDSSRWGRR
ncbi:MAG TPA: hypothetical protein VIJ59_00570 [Caulobacteraceae bacterium]